MHLWCNALLIEKTTLDTTRLNKVDCLCEENNVANACVLIGRFHRIRVTVRCNVIRSLEHNCLFPRISMKRNRATLPFRHLFSNEYVIVYLSANGVDLDCGNWFILLIRCDPKELPWANSNGWDSRSWRAEESTAWSRGFHHPQSVICLLNDLMNIAKRKKWLYIIRIKLVPSLLSFRTNYVASFDMDKEGKNAKAITRPQ